MSVTSEDTSTAMTAESDAENGAEDHPVVTVRHRSSGAVSRRRFISGSLAMGAGAVLGTGKALAADCDQNREQVERCSDGDQGEGADPANCGRCGQESTVPSSYRMTDPGQFSNRQYKNLPDVSTSVKRITD